MEWIFSRSYLSQSPSRKDGISEELERAYRLKTALFIEALGTDLRRQLNRIVISTAIVFCQRFYTMHSFKQYDRLLVAAACLYLAAKAEESYFRLQDMVRVYLARRKQGSGTFLITDDEGFETEKKIIEAEKLVLCTLCFDIQIAHPYTHCVKNFKILKSYILDDASTLQQDAINMVNDRSPLCLQFPSDQIATAAVFLSVLSSPLPVNIVPKISVELTWLELLQFDFDLDDLKCICVQLLDLYSGSQQATGEVPPKVDTKKIQSLRTLISELGSEARVRSSSGSVGSEDTSPDTVANPPSGPYVARGYESLKSVLGYVGTDRSSDKCKRGMSDEFKEVDIVSEEYPYGDEELCSLTMRQPAIKVTVVKPAAASFNQPASHSSSSSSVWAVAAGLRTETAGVRMAQETPEHFPLPPLPAVAGQVFSRSFGPGGFIARTMSPAIDSPVPPPPPDTPSSTESSYSATYSSESFYSNSNRVSISSQPPARPVMTGKVSFPGETPEHFPLPPSSARGRSNSLDSIGETPEHFPPPPTSFLDYSGNITTLKRPQDTPDYFPPPPSLDEMIRRRSNSFDSTTGKVLEHFPFVSHVVSHKPIGNNPVGVPGDTPEHFPLPPPSPLRPPSSCATEKRAELSSRHLSPLDSPFAFPHVGSDVKNVLPAAVSSVREPSAKKIRL